MKINYLVTILLLLLSNTVTGFADVSAQVGGSGSTNSELPSWEMDKQNDFGAITAKAEKGDPEAEYELGISLWKTNAKASIQWLVKAAEQNNKKACYNLGIRFDMEDSPELNTQKAFKFALRGAQLGDMDCASLVSMYYLSGIGTATNVAKGIEWLEKAADQGDSRSQLDLAHRYYTGDEVTKSLTNAIHYYKLLADQNDVKAQSELGYIYSTEIKDYPEAAKWTRKAAEAGDEIAEYNLAKMYEDGRGVVTNYTEAAKWFRKAAEQGMAEAQHNLGECYRIGEGVNQDFMEAVKWFRRAANQGYSDAQNNLGLAYMAGQGVPQDYVEAYKWLNLAATAGDKTNVWNRNIILRYLTPSQISEAQRLCREFVPREETAISSSDNSTSPENPTASGSGFFITDDGYLISNYHVVKDATKVRLLTSAGLIDAKVVQVDAANDLALLKANAEGRMKNEETFKPLPIAASRTVALGGTVATVGFPDIGLQGFAPKLAKGEIASLSGAGDDPRYFQISVPVQPGNSGGALVDERGNVIGIVSAKLDASAALAASGALPENVNYAVKSSLLLSFLESVPDVDAKLKAPVTADRKFGEVVKSAQDAAVLVLVY